MGLAIHLLGVPRVLRDGVAVPAPRGRKVWALLAFLLMSDAPASRTHLAALLFEDAEDPLAALRWNLSELRRLIGSECLRGDAPAIQLPPATYVDVDVVSRGTWVQAVAAAGLDRELLEGMSFPTSPSFDAWLAAERSRLLSTAAAVLREATMARLAAGETAEAIQFAGRLVGLNPLDEGSQALLVRSLAVAGDGVGAARQAAACVALFERELGVTPGAALDEALRTATGSSTKGPAIGKAAVLALVEAGDAAISAGALDAGLQSLRRAIVEADAIAEPALQARTRVSLGSALVHAARGRDEEGSIALHEALVFARQASPPLAAAANRELGYVEFLRGRYERALVWLNEAASLVGDDRAEQARIATVRGSALSDTGHYGKAVAELNAALALAEGVGDVKQSAYALSMLGRAQLLCGELDDAVVALDRSLALCQREWIAFVPWPQSLRAEVELLRGDVAAASQRLEHAFALGCHLGDPCWEGIAGRGLGLVASLSGRPQDAVEVLVDAIARCVRLPDAYLWAKAYALDALCALAVRERYPQAGAWIGELEGLAARSGMREMTVRAHLHRAALGDTASASAARVLASEIDNALLSEMAGVPA